MKKVYLRGRSQNGPIHSLYRSLVNFPPEGYQILGGKIAAKPQQGPAPSVGKKRFLIQSFDKSLGSNSYSKGVWQEAKTLSYMFIKKTQRSRRLRDIDADLIYSSQQLAFTKRPWLADFEFANALVDYNDIKLGRDFVRRALASKYCRKVLPWSDWSNRTLRRSVDCRSFENKIETVHFGIEPKTFAKEASSDRLRLLFVGSINQLNYLNFEWKGGFEVIDAFTELSKRYDDLELTVRSWAPPEALEKCRKNPKIKLIYSPLSDDEMTHLYASSDIFMFPSYLNLGMVILEAMSYELPVVAPRLYDVPEAVKDMETGVLLDNPPSLPLYIWNGAPNHRDPNLLHGIREQRSWRVKQLVEKTSVLIEDGSLRRRIGREARRLVGEGEFSIQNRNKKLKRIFDEATETLCT